MYISRKSAKICFCFFGFINIFNVTSFSSINLSPTGVLDADVFRQGRTENLIRGDSQRRRDPLQAVHHELSGHRGDRLHRPRGRERSGAKTSQLILNCIHIEC